MLTLQGISLGEEMPCSYLPGRIMRNQYFFAMNLNSSDLEALLSEGWRKFGYYFFRPSCPDCMECVPIRILADEFVPAKSHRRVINKNCDMHLVRSPLRYSDDLFRMYYEHSLYRFGQEATMEDFIFNFYHQSCPSLQTEYYLNKKLVAAGYCDHSSQGLSSVYFIFTKDVERRSPGIFSVLREIELAREMDCRYYYLGYYVRGCPRMDYKDKFKPCEKYSWIEKKWIRED